MSQPPPEDPQYAPQYPPQYAPQQPSPSYPAPGYSPQYGFLPYYHATPDALLGPARRASLILFLLGGLLLLFTTCVGGSALFSTEEVLAKTIEDMRQVNPQAAEIYTPQVLRTVQIAMAVVIGLVALTAIILGVVVRSGSRGSAITALVLVLLPSFVVGLMLLSTLFAGPATFLTASALMLLPFILVVMAITSLIGAIRAAPQIEAARRQMYAMHQHQQMQYQAYLQQPPQS